MRKVHAQLYIHLSIAKFSEHPSKSRDTDNISLYITLISDVQVTQAAEEVADPHHGAQAPDRGPGPLAERGLRSPSTPTTEADLV